MLEREAGRAARSDSVAFGAMAGELGEQIAWKVGQAARFLKRPRLPPGMPKGFPFFAGGVVGYVELGGVCDSAGAVIGTFGAEDADGAAGALWSSVPAALWDAGRRARCSTGCAMPGAASLHQWLHSAGPRGPGGRRREAGRRSWRRWIVVVRIRRKAYSLGTRTIWSCVAGGLNDEMVR